MNAEEMGVILLQIRELHLRREMAVRMKVRIENAVGATARRLMGWKRDLPEAEGKRIRTKAASLIGLLMKGEEPAEGDLQLALALSPLIDAARESLPPWKRLAKANERDMCKLASKLPAASFVAEVRGFGMVQFAQILGETGDLANYANPAKLWKRMGLAVMPDGKPQRRIAGDADAAVAAGYSPTRRKIMFLVSDTLIKGNRGEFYALYTARKTMELERLPADAKGRRLHADRRARRFIAKRLLRNLWRAWHGQGEVENHVQPAAPLS